jgi:hypothetical protein
VLTDIGQENPPEWIFVQRHRTRDLITFRPVLFQKHYMTPRGCPEVTGVIVGISRPGESVIGNVVPFFARHFASFAANANGRVGEETNLYVFLDVIVPALICTLRSVTDHR